jgi:hypothetical protein
MLLQVSDTRQRLVKGGLALTVALGICQDAATKLEQVRTEVAAAVEATSGLTHYLHNAPERMLHARMADALGDFARVRAAAAARGVQVPVLPGEAPPPVSRL